MGYFETPEGVAEYLEMVEGQDGRKLVAKLFDFLPRESTVLELGMGPGSDLDLLAERCRVTGSDTSTLFLERYLESHPGADVLELDAITLETDRSFDGLFEVVLMERYEEFEEGDSIFVILRKSDP